MSRARPAAVRQRRPRRGGDLRPGAQRGDDRRPLRRQPTSRRPPRSRLARPAADRPDGDLQRLRPRAIPTARSPSTSGTSTATAPTRPTPARRPRRRSTYTAAGPVDVGLRVTDNTGGDRAPRRVPVDGGGARHRVLHPARCSTPPGSRTTGAWASPRARPSPTARAARAPTTSGGPTLGAPGAVAGDTDTAARFDGTDDRGRRERRPLRHQQADGRVLAEVERLRQRRPPGDGVHPELQRQRRRLPGRSQRARSRAASSASGIGSGAARNNVFFTRPSAGAWHHYAFVLDTTAPAANQITALRRRPGGGLHEDRHGHGAGQLRQLDAVLHVAGRQPLFGAGDLDEVAIYNRALSAATIAAHFGGNAQPPTSSFTATPNPAQTGQTVTLQRLGLERSRRHDRQVRVGPRRQRHLRDRHRHDARPPRAPTPPRAPSPSACG